MARKEPAKRLVARVVARRICRGAPRRSALSSCDVNWADEPTERPVFPSALPSSRVPIRQSSCLVHFRARTSSRSTKSEAPFRLHRRHGSSMRCDFVHMYSGCEVHGLILPHQTVLQRQFVQLLSRQTGARPEVDPLGDVGVTAELLWTSRAASHLTG